MATTPPSLSWYFMKFASYSTAGGGVGWVGGWPESNQCSALLFHWRCYGLVPVAHCYQSDINIRHELSISATQYTGDAAATCCPLSRHVGVLSSHGR